MRIGIDMGGTKIEGVLLDDAGVVVARERVTTPKHDYEATVTAVARLVETLESRTTPSRPPSIGVGTPGAASPATGLMRNCNSTWLNGRRLGDDLARALGRPVRLANDANCFALSEAVDGAAAGAEVVFGVILGTGVGGGIAVRGRALVGPNAIAGEWGHNPFPHDGVEGLPGPSCYCGKRGCIETYLSGPGLAADHARVEGTGEGGVDLAPETIVERAGYGDERCERSLERYESRLARALATVINLLDPDVIVLGGGLSQVPRLYRNVPRLWARWVFSDSVTTPLVPPRHGDSSGVRGAAWLWGRDEGS